MRAPYPSNVDLLQVDWPREFLSKRSELFIGRRSRGRSRAILNRKNYFFLKSTSNDARVRVPEVSPCPVSVFSVLHSSRRCSRCFFSNTAVFSSTNTPTNSC